MVAAALSAAAERAVAERSAGERPLPPLTAPSLQPEPADTAAAPADRETSALLLVTQTVAAALSTAAERAVAE
eukprot:7141059-Prymnesium_polylepis.1